MRADKIRPHSIDLFFALATQACASWLWLALGLSWAVPGLVLAGLVLAGLVLPGRVLPGLRVATAGQRAAVQRQAWAGCLLLIALAWGGGAALQWPADANARAALLALGLSQALALPRLAAGPGAALGSVGLVLLPMAVALAMQGEQTWAGGLFGLALLVAAPWMRSSTRSAVPETSNFQAQDGAGLEVGQTTQRPSSPDPTDQRVAKLEREADQAREQAGHALAAAHQAVREKTRFLAAASHDLRQPVHAIGLFVGALKEEIRDGRGRYLVDRLERSMAGLDELFNRLLDISRLDAGTIDPRISVFAIVPLLQTLETRFAHMAQQRNLDLRVHMPRPCSVRSDPALLVEILMNLLSNAFRYTEHGGILMGTRRRGDRLLIQVWDTGIGIAPEQIDKIFGEFVQLGNSSRDRRHGLGLGLAIVRRLSDGLNCPVAVRSRPKRGTVFEISVPLSAEPAPVEQPTDPDFDPAILQGMLVLVVDDELDILIGMEALLVSWGCFVILARSVAEARRHLDQAERFPDLLITDHRLGENTGSADVVAAVTELVPVPVPVIVVSGDATAHLQDLSARHGWALLPKPVNPERLRSLVVALTQPG